MILLKIVIFLPQISTIVATNIGTLENVIVDVGKDKLTAGKNLNQLGDDSIDYLARKGSVGIVLEIENYSGLALVDPEIYLYAGEKDKE